MCSVQRVAIVTGAANGIGRATALRLAQDGFDVAVNDLPRQESRLQEVSEEIKALGRNALVFTGDVSDEISVKGLVDATVESLGGLDCMVANAGICPAGSFLDMSTEDFDLTFQINVRSVFLCYKYAAKAMIKQGRGGRIIGASSGAGKQAIPLLSAYSSSKFGVRGLTQGVAGELGQHNITVNAYAPGGIDTEMGKLIFAQYYRHPFLTKLLVRKVSKDLAAGDPDAVVDEQIKRVPLGRFGVAEEVAGVISFIAGPDSSYVTGQTLSVNGGWFYD